MQMYIVVIMYTLDMGFPATNALEMTVWNEAQAGFVYWVTIQDLTLKISKIPIHVVFSLIR